jgi:hypothetical protein
VKRTVHFTQVVSIPVTVDVDEFTEPDDIIAEAYNEGPAGLCVSCTGGSRYGWSRDDAGDLVPVSITDENGRTVWTDTVTDDDEGED